MKSLISLILTFFMIVSLFVSSAVVTNAASAVSPLTDVTDNDWFYENVMYVYENGIMYGVGNGKFEPRSYMSRAMSVTILYRMAGEPDASKFQHSFKDVKTHKWYSDAVAWGYENGIVNGRSDTVFAPEDNITRGEFAAVLWRYAEYAELALPAVRIGNLADENYTPFYARPAAKAMYQAEVINGRPGYMFDSFDLITRSEAAAIIDRFIKKAVPADSVVEPEVPEYDPELYTDVVFLGNSFTATGNTPWHFNRIAEDKLVQVSDYSKSLYSLEMHLEWFLSEYNKEELDRVTEYADVIVFQEFGGYYPSTEYMEGLMDIFGRDKKYYAVLPFIGPSVSDPNDNEEFLNSKEQYLEQYGVQLVYVSNVVDYDSSLGFDPEDFHKEGDYHPNDVMGYSIALAMYCSVFDENAAEQNDGELSLYMIPGDTEKEKKAFMVKLKDTVQGILDIQK